MLASLALALAWVPQGSPPTTTINGILNGSFDKTGPGKLSDTLTDADAGFFVGGEGHTILESGTDRALLLKTFPADQNHLVYQRVGVPKDYAGSAEIQATVTVPAGDEARISLVEADLYFLASWVLGGPNQIFFAEDPDGSKKQTEPNEQCWEVDPIAYGNTTAHKMDWLQGGAAGFRSPSTTGNIVEWSMTTLVTQGVGPNAGYIELRLTAPKTGTIKVISRPWTFQPAKITEPDPTRDVEHQIRLFDGSVATLVRTDMLDSTDPNGPVIVERMNVNEGDQIWLRARRMWDGTGDPDDARFIWHPAIVYEGRSVTWRFGDSLLGCVKPPPNVQCHPTTAGVPETVTLQAGSFFNAAFGSDPKPPLEVTLIAESSSGGVTFDDVSCNVQFEAVEESDLRAAILEEALWERRNVTGKNPNGHDNIGILDATTNNQGLRLGDCETPYAVHDLDVVTGTETVTEGVVSGPHPRLWSFLSRRYLPTPTEVDDYEHFFHVKEMERFENLSPAGLIYFKYDVVTDSYLPGAANYDNGIDPIFIDLDEGETGNGVGLLGPIEFIELYKKTNDFTFLELAVTYSKWVQMGGVVDEDTSLTGPPAAEHDRIGILSGKQYDIDTGEQLLLTPQGELDADDAFGVGPKWIGKHQHLRATTALLQTYAHARIFNIQNPTSPKAFNPTDLDDIRMACDTSVLAAKDVLDPVGFPVTNSWRANWHTLIGHFQDNFGNQAPDAVAAIQALDELAAVQGMLTAQEGQIRANLVSGWLQSGIDQFFEPWVQAVARYEFSAGDEVRGWIPIFQVLDGNISTGASASNADIVTQFHDAALNAVKYQFADPPSATNPRSGFWTSAGLQKYQLADLGPGFGGSTRAAASFVRGIGYAYALLDPTTQAQERAELRAVMLAMLEGNQEHFKTKVFKPAGDGYGYWDSVYNQGGSQPAGIEGRAIEPILFVIDGMPPTTGLAAPQPSISPASFEQTIVKGVPYTFTLTWPGPVPFADMETSWTQRTRVVRWKKILKGSCSSNWSRWVPTLLTSFTFVESVETGPSHITYQTTASYPLPPAAPERTKFTIRTWDVHGRWNQDTSIQEGP